MESKFRYEPKCPISLTDTNNGGIIIKPHISSSGIECKPNGVLDTSTAFDMVISNPTNIKCYICRSKIISDDFKTIGKEELIEQSNSDIFSNINRLIENPYNFNIKKIEINMIPSSLITHKFVLNALNVSITTARNISINKLLDDLGHIKIPNSKIIVDGILNLKQKKSSNTLLYEAQYLTICLFVNEVALSSTDFNTALSIVVANYVNELINQVYYTSDLKQILKLGLQIVKDLCALEYTNYLLPNIARNNIYLKKASIDKIIKKYT